MLVLSVSQVYHDWTLFYVTNRSLKYSFMWPATAFYKQIKQTSNTSNPLILQLFIFRQGKTFYIYINVYGHLDFFLLFLLNVNT